MHPTNGMTPAKDKYSEHLQTGIHMNNLISEFIMNSSGAPIDFTKYDEENPEYMAEYDLELLEYTDFL